MPGGLLPLIAITEAINFPLGLLTGGDNQDLDDFFAAFAPVPGGTILEQEIARYPFANQGVAANAVIAQPTRIAMLMVCPARNNFGYYEKLAVIEALQAAMSLHNSTGGLYHILTPSFIYLNCIFRRMSDVTPGFSKQPQATWLLEFEKPLVTLADAQSAQSSLMTQLTALTKVNATNGALSYSGALATIPAPSLASPAASPALIPTPVTGGSTGTAPSLQ